MKAIILIITLIVLVVLFGGCIQENRDLKLQIYEDVSAANYCEKSEDCIIENFGCPFGCGSFVNKNTDVQKIREKIANFHATSIPCKYSCVSPKEPQCINNKCTIPSCELDKNFEQTPTNCICPSGSDIDNILDEKNNRWLFACKQRLCETGKKYESAWRFYDGTWWDECLCPPSATRSKNQYWENERYFFTCN